MKLLVRRFIDPDATFEFWIGRPQIPRRIK